MCRGRKKFGQFSWKHLIVLYLQILKNRQYCFLNFFSLSTWISGMASYSTMLFSYIFLTFFYVQLRSQALFLDKQGKSLGTCSRDYPTQCNDTVFVTYLSLFSVASFSGETVRCDNAADIANETVGLHRILPCRLQNFEVVLLSKCLVIYRLIFQFLTPINRVKRFVF